MDEVMMIMFHLQANRACALRCGTEEKSECDWNFKNEILNNSASLVQFETTCRFAIEIENKLNYKWDKSDSHSVILVLTCVP